MYKWVDQDGNISYSDQPPFKNAEKLDAPALTTVPAANIPDKKLADSNPQVEQDLKKKTSHYSYLKITSPENDATIRNNEGNFSISIAIKPPLNIKQGHYLSVNMDGTKVRDKLSTSSTNLTNVNRGTHSINVSVNDKQGKVLHKSKNITVHMHRQSVIRKQAK